MFLAFAHTDYRSLLRSWLEARPRQRSMRSLADRLETTHSRISMICRGERDLPVDEVYRWVEALGLEGAERGYFEALVRQDHAPTLKLRRDARWEAAAARALARSTGGDEFVPLFGSVVAQVSYEARRVGVHLTAEDLHPPVTPEVLDDAALACDVASGRSHLATDDRVRSVDLARAVRGLHDEALVNARRSLHDDPPALHVFQSLVVALPSADLPVLEQRLRDAVLAALAPWADRTDADRVFQLAVQLVPRTGTLKP